MNLHEFSAPITAKKLNETMASRYSQQLDLDKFTTEQLEDARNKLRTKLSQIETNESFSSVQTDSYAKDKLFLDIINAEILEREEHITVAIDEAISLREGAEDSAEIVMAAKDMVDRVTGWMEDTAEMQTESMLELADAIRDEMGSEQSEAFVNAVKPALESMYTTMESTREALTLGVGMLTGEAEAPDAMGDDDTMPGDDDTMEPTVDSELDTDDDFATSEPAVGGEDEEAGREKRESVSRSKKKV